MVLYRTVLRDWCWMYLFFRQIIIMKIEMKTTLKEKETVNSILQGIAKSRGKKKIGKFGMRSNVTKNRPFHLVTGDGPMLSSKTTLAAHSIVYYQGLITTCPPILRLYTIINEQRYTESFPHPVLLRSLKQFVWMFHIFTQPLSAVCTIEANLQKARSQLYFFVFLVFSYRSK